MSTLSENTKAGGWGEKEKADWFARQTIQRSYGEDVVARLGALQSEKFGVSQYGALTFDPERYPLYCVLTADWKEENPSILITGGVHGYEPSGIISPLRFLEETASQYADRINFAVYPCISPLAYEINHRWNQKAQDPNRHFLKDTTVEESEQLMRSVKSLGTYFRAAIDLHETNGRDVELRRERHARDGDDPLPGEDFIPKGFYLCVPKKEDVPTGRQIVEAVREVTAICTDEKIIGYTSDNGVIVIDNVRGLCQEFARTISDVAMTTEIYPDESPVRESQEAQLAVIKKAITLTLNPA